MLRERRTRRLPCFGLKNTNAEVLRFARDDGIGAVFHSLLENNEPAIRKCYRKEMQITTKSEAIAKVYVIENEIVR